MFGFSQDLVADGFELYIFMDFSLLRCPLNLKVHFFHMECPILVFLQTPHVQMKVLCR